MFPAAPRVRLTCCGSTRAGVRGEPLPVDTNFSLRNARETHLLLLTSYSNGSRAGVVSELIGNVGNVNAFVVRLKRVIKQSDGLGEVNVNPFPSHLLSSLTC